MSPSQELIHHGACESLAYFSWLGGSAVYCCCFPFSFHHYSVFFSICIVAALRNLPFRIRLQHACTDDAETCLCVRPLCSTCTQGKMNIAWLNFCSKQIYLEILVQRRKATVQSTFWIIFQQTHHNGVQRVAMTCAVFLHFLLTIKGLVKVSNFSLEQLFLLHALSNSVEAGCWWQESNFTISRIIILLRFTVPQPE